MTDERLNEIGELLNLLGKETRHGPLPRQTENKLLQAAFELYEEVQQNPLRGWQDATPEERATLFCPHCMKRNEKCPCTPFGLKTPEEEGLKPCPFCGGEAEFERKGTGRQSCIVQCTDCGARHESGDTWNSGASWNQRADAQETP